jgi:hypothetical protein
MSINAFWNPSNEDAVEHELLYGNTMGSSVSYENILLNSQTTVF